MYKQQKNGAYLLVLILIFGAIFLSMLTAFISYIVTQHKAQTQNYNKEQALNIAEAGLNYYKWFLAHYPNDMKNGTGLPGPYVGVYSDPEGGPIGTYSLTIASSTACGQVYAVDITSQGNTYAAPNAGRKVYGRYARPTVAEFAYIINSNVWAGADRTIVGPYHSNGGVRMDGTNNSTVSSGQSTWSCTSTYGCSPTATKDGVFGGGVNSDLWSYPSTPINFTGLSVDLAAMKTKAQTVGRYIPKSPAGKYGYRIKFRADGQMEVYIVDTVTSYYGYNNDDGWKTESNVIATDHLLATYTVPTACSVVFVEDKVWLEGVVKNKITIAAADLVTAGVDRSIILQGNITYATATSGLLAVAEDDVLVGLTVPDAMTLNGIFAAQNGRFGRNRYCGYTSGGSDELCSNTYQLPSGGTNLRPYSKRSSLTVNGTIVSNGREGTKWTSGGTYVSGFSTRFNSYDRKLVADPPPLTPNVSDTYQFIEWRELN